MTRDAFERGVYDTATLDRDASAVNQHQVDPAPGARFWVPSFSEWLKAAHWDPRRPNADGSLGGYWKYPNSSDTQMTPGLPGTPGARTSAGAHEFQPVASYPTHLSPWGLLDLSGGAREMTGSLGEGAQRSILIQAGASALDPARFDRLGPGFSLDFSSGEAGLRLAGLVPSSSVTSLTAVLVPSWAFSRRRSPCFAPSPRSQP